MSRFLLPFSLVSAVALFAGNASAQVVVNTSPVTGKTYESTKITISGTDQEISGSTFIAGNSEVNTTSDNGIITISNGTTFNGNNTITANRQSYNNGTDTVPVGGTVTVTGDLTATGQASGYTTTISGNSSDVIPAINVSDGNLTIDHATLSFNGTTAITPNNNTSPNNYLSMNNNSHLLFNGGSASIGSGATSALLNMNLTGNTYITNQNATSVLSISKANIHSITSGSNGGFATISGATRVSDSTLSIDGGTSVSDGSTLAFDNVVFDTITLNMGRYSTLDLTGSATFNNAQTFIDGTVNVHDATVTFNGQTNFNGADLTLNGTNSLLVPTDESNPGYGLYINNASSVMDVVSGRTTVSGTTNLQAGQVEVRNGADLTFSKLNYTGGALAVDAGGRLTLAETANFDVDTNFKGTVALDGASNLTLAAGTDSYFDGSSAALELSGTQNVIAGGTDSDLYVRDGASINALANSETKVTTDSTTVSGANINIGSAAHLSLTDLTFGENSLGTASTLANEGTLELIGTADFTHDMSFTGGTIALNKATFNTTADSNFSGANFTLDDDNTVSEVFTMTGGTLRAGAVTGGTTTFAKDAIISADLVDVKSAYELIFDGYTTIDSEFTNAGTVQFNKDAEFKRLTTFSDGTVILSNGADLLMRSPLTINTNGVLKALNGDSVVNGQVLLTPSGYLAADNANLSIGTLTATGGTVQLSNGGTFTINGASSLDGTLAVRTQNGGWVSGTATLGSGASLTLTSDSVFDGSLNLANGSLVNLGVDSSTVFGSFTGDLGTVNPTDVASLNLIINPQFTGTSIKVANANSGNIDIGATNLFYNLAWTGTDGTISIGRKNNDEIRVALERAGSTPNQASTIVGLITASGAGDIATKVIEKASADIQSGNIARANDNADAFAPEMAPMALSLASQHNYAIMNAVSNRLGSNRRRIAANRSNQTRRAQPIYQDGYRYDGYGQYQPNADYYYRQRAEQQKNWQDNNYYRPRQEVYYQDYADSIYGRNSGDIIMGRSSLWVEGLYNKSTLKDDKLVPGYDSDGHGLAIGLDHTFDNAFKIGVGYAYNTDTVDGKGRQTDIDTHTGFIYGEIKPNEWYLNAIASYGMSSYSETKTPYGLSISSDYDGNAMAAQVMTGYEFGNIAPEIGLRYLSVTLDDYTDGAGQLIKNKDSDVITAILGVKSSRNLFGRSTLDWRLAATYDVKQSEGSADVLLPNGVAYKLSGRSLDKWGIEGGVGINLSLGKSDISLSYEGQFRKDYQNHTGLLQFRYKF